MSFFSWDELHDSKPPPGGRGGGPKGPPPGSGGGPGGPQFDIPQIKFPKFKGSTFLFAVIALLALWIIPGTIYFVEQDEEGVVLRFGKYVRTTQPGMRYKFPSPIEHVYTPKVRKVRRSEIGFRINNNGQVRDFPHESLMLTGDQNIVDIDLVVQWDIKDAKDFLFNIKAQGKSVRDVAETVMRGIVGAKKIDEVLTSGKAEIQDLLKVQMQGLLDKYVSGVRITATQLQDVNPPAQVISAFKDVVSAREDKERSINEAQGYRNAVIPQARGKSAQIVRNAEAYREEKIKRAEGDVARFLQHYEEYKKAPEITRKRIYLETMEQIYPKMKKFVMPSKGGGVLPVLPLGQGLDSMAGSKR